MKVNPKAFFNFCAEHVTVLRALMRRESELSDAEVFRMIRSSAADHSELPETTWRRLLEFQILVPTEPGATTFLLAEPVLRLLSYLFDEANPATPEMIRGYIASLETLGKQLARAIDREDVTGVALAFNELNGTLRRIHADLEQTQRSIQNEVASFKTSRQQVSVRDKFRRIVHWMERYVEPMIDVVRADGPLRAAFDEVEQLLRRAREEALFNDHPALERNLRFLRLLRAHALRIFQQCRREIEPLYQSLRRSSFMAQGAALALTRLQKEGLGLWGTDPLIGVFTMRWQHVPSDEAIERAVQRVVEHPPEPPPVLALASQDETPPALLRRLWLDSLLAEVQPELPVDDLLGWLMSRHPGRPVSELLSGFTALAFRDDFNSTFTANAPREYPAGDGVIRGHPLRLELP